MFDFQRICRVLYLWSKEDDDFIIAQDGHLIMQELLGKVARMDDYVDEFTAFVSEGKRDAPMHIQEQYDELMLRLADLKLRREVLLDHIVPLADLASRLWLCCPCDGINVVPEPSYGLWSACKDDRRNLPERYAKGAAEFRARCHDSLLALDPDFLDEVAMEEERIRQLSERTLLGLINDLPMRGLEHLWEHHQLMFCSAYFPRTHLYDINQNCATQLGFSRVRLIAFPMAHVSLNNMELDDMTRHLMASSSPCKVNMIYRCADRRLMVAHWEISGVPLENGLYCAWGVHITPEVEYSKTERIGNIQKMLRQWLHSIRNASFEQQALVLLEEIRNLQSSMATETDKHTMQFGNLVDGLRMLIHTAKTSVGLIDQALQSKGLVQQMSVADFANSLMKFPHNFAESEGIVGGIPVKFQVLFNDRVVESMSALDSLVVKCDVISIQAFVDNVLSNSVRYTDPSRGIVVTLNISHEKCGESLSLPTVASHRDTDLLPTQKKTFVFSRKHEDATPLSTGSSSPSGTVPPSPTSMQLAFKLCIQDFCPGGLPESALGYLRAGLGKHKCIDERVGSPSRSNSRSGSDSKFPSTLENSPVQEEARASSSSSSFSTSDHSANRSPSISATAHRIILPDSDSSESSHEPSPVHHDRPLATPAVTPSRARSTRATTPGVDVSFSGASDATSPWQSPVRGDTRRRGIKTRSTGTGLPHLFELYEHLAQSTEDQFDFSLRTSQGGTTFNIKFHAVMMAPFNTRLLFSGARNYTESEERTSSLEFAFGDGPPSSGSLYLGSTSGSSALGSSGTSSAWSNSMTRSDAPPFCHKLIIGTILVVDDSAVIRKLLSKYLNDLKCPHQLCCDGEEALAWYKENHEDCAGIITDQEMPRMGGDALIARARAINASVPCFMVSGNEISAGMLPPGVRRAIVKPVSASVLEGIVDEIEALQMAESASETTGF